MIRRYSRDQIRITNNSGVDLHIAWDGDDNHLEFIITRKEPSKTKGWRCMSNRCKQWRGLKWVDNDEGRFILCKKHRDRVIKEHPELHTKVEE